MNISRSIIIPVLLFFSLDSYAVNYSLPANIGSGAFSSCSGSAGVFSCSNKVTLNNNDTVILSGDVSLNINADIDIKDNVVIDENDFVFDITVTGKADIGKNSTVSANITAGDDVKIDDNSTFTGNINSDGKVELDKNVVFIGGIGAVDDVKLDENVNFTGLINSDSKVEVKKNSTFNGNISAGDDVKIDENIVFTGNIFTTGNLDIKNSTTVNGVCSPSHPQCTDTASGLTCTTSKIAADGEEFRGISGSSDGNIIAVGKNGSLYHYDGTSWTKNAFSSNEDLNDVEVVSASLAFAVGKKGKVVRFNGSNWSTLTAPNNEELLGVWAASNSELWVVGKKNSLYLWNGSSWANMSGASQANVDNNAELTEAWGDANYFYAVEKDGDIYRYNRTGGPWTKLTACNSAFDMEATDVWGDGSGNVYLAGKNKSANPDEATVFWFNQGSNSCTSLFSTSREKSLEGVHGFGSTIYAVGKDGLVLENSSGAWTEDIRGTADFKDVWVSNTRTAYYAGKKGFVTVCTVPVAPLDHYSISHAGVGVTCEAESVTITAHDASDIAVVPSSSTTITLSTSIANDGWALRSGSGVFNPPNQYTFDGVESSVQFWLSKTSVTTVPHMDIDVSDGSISDLDDAGLEDPVLEFRKSALRFYSDGNYNLIGTQIAGKTSDIVTDDLTLRAVQTNTDTGACEARVAGNQTVQMAFECVTPATCKTGDGVSITDTTLSVSTPIKDNASGSVSMYADVELVFDASGTASWTMNYQDAGRIALHASLSLAASPPDPADNLIATSNTFTSKPAGFCVSSPDANADCASADVSCSSFKKAGENFNLAVRAVAWQTAGESNTEFCIDNATTPNFQLAGINITHSPVGPATIAAGTAGVGVLDVVAMDDGNGVISNQTISEVGVFTFLATAPDYFGATIAASTSASIGRFYPDHFQLSAGFINNRITLGGGGIFTYMDENFQISYTLTAQNSSNGTTQNYSSAGGFAQLDNVAELNYGTADTLVPVNLSPRFTTGTPGINWTNGSLSIVDTGSISRNVIADGPYTQLDVGLAPTDEDSVLLDSYDLDVDADLTDDHGIIGTTRVRFGRMALENAFGSELLTLNMPMMAEYFDGSNFVLNTDDNLTALSTANLILSSSVEAGQIDGDIQVLAGQVSQATIANNPLLMGNGQLSFCPPGNPDCTPAAGNVGDIDVTIDLTLLPYLRFDWDGDSANDDNPEATASFGLYSGNPVNIYIQQIYQ